MSKKNEKKNDVSDFFFAGNNGIYIYIYIFIMKKKIWCRKRGLGYCPTVLQGLEVLYCRLGLYCSRFGKGCIVKPKCIVT